MSKSPVRPWEAWRREFLPIAQGILHNREDAEDAVQTAFLELLSTNIPQQNIESGIISVRVNWAAYAILRSSRRRRKREYLYFADRYNIFSFIPNFFSLNLDNILSFREMIIIKMIADGYSNSEIGIHLGLKVNSITKYAYVARKKVRETYVSDFAACG